MIDDGAKKVFKLGLLGLGTVGAGVAKIIRESKPSLSDKTGLDIRLHKVAVRDLKKARSLALDPNILTTNAMSVAIDPEVDILVEVIGGIEPARSLLTAALKAGKSVITANKALLATHGKELFELALAHHTSIGFEASVCGGVPVIDAIRDGLVANRIDSIHAILNGTTNYILTRMIESGASYTQALYEAQSKGYAEADPSTDVKGIDAGHKLTLLSNLAFHSIFDFDEAHIEGIDSVNIDDVRFAADLGYTLKLLGIAKRRSPGADSNEFPGGIELRVHPTLIPNTHPLANVRDVFNAVLVKGDATGEVMLYGRGAGMMPTASAVISDIIDAARGSARQAFTKLQFFQNPRSDLPVIPMSKTQSRYYVRFRVADQPGTMGKICTALGERGVSIASVMQKQPHEGGDVPIVMLTHTTTEQRFKGALAEIERLQYVRGPSSFFRVED